MQTSALGAGAALVASAQTEQESSTLRGEVRGEKLQLPPLHNPTENAGAPPNPEPVSKRMGVAVVGIGHLTMEQILPGFA